jgi:hypothetical protein
VYSDGQQHAYRSEAAGQQDTTQVAQPAVIGAIMAKVRAAGWAGSILGPVTWPDLT